MKRKLTIIAAVVFALGCALALAGCGGSESGGDATKANTGDGPVAAAPTGTYNGQDNDGVQEFLGIRYAAPVERWKAASDVTTTTDDQIDATKWGPCCIQPYDEVEIASQGELSEDCLNLNIWTKDVQTTGKPVMVFIHGGGFMNGGSHDPMYEGDNFVRNVPEGEDMVFVSINYRTNLFGSIDLSPLEGYTDEYADSINLWILDQIQALKWINENIEAFGGDPGNVTLCGQSCGGMAISYMLSMEDTHKYFQKAIIESGAPHIAQQSKAKKQEAAKMAFDIFDVESLDDFLALSADDIKDNGLDEYFENLGGLTNIYADGKIIPADWWDKIMAGSAKDVKVMIGSMSGENDWAAYDAENAPKTWDNPEELWEAYIVADAAERSDEHGTKVKYFINPVNKDIDPTFDLEAFLATDKDRTKAMTDLYNAMCYVQGTEYEAEALSKYADTYAYYWTYAPDPESVIEYCKANEMEPEVSPYARPLHSMGMLFGLGNTEDGYNEISGDPAKLPKDLQPMMMSAFYNFVKSGDPNNELIPQWDKYDDTDRNTMVMGEKWKLTSDPRKAQREAFSVRPQGEK